MSSKTKSNFFNTPRYFFLKYLVLLFTLSRLIAPFFIFKNQFLAIILNLFFDIIDGVIFTLAGIKWHQYEVIDKILDLYWYVFIFVFILMFPPPVYLFWLLIFFFLIRLCAHIFYFATKNVKIFIILPNIFERLFWLYILSLKFHLPLLIQPSMLVIILPLGILLIFLHEYLLHKKNFAVINLIFGKKIIDKET